MCKGNMDFCTNPSFCLLTGMAAAQIKTSEMQKFSACTSLPLNSPKMISLFTDAALGAVPPSTLSIPGGMTCDGHTTSAKNFSARVANPSFSFCLIEQG